MFSKLSSLARSTADRSFVKQPSVQLVRLCLSLAVLFVCISICAPAHCQTFTWIKGSSAPGQGGAYGTQGTEDSANTPGARDSAVTWIDSSGNFWLFSGLVGSSSFFNDLWKYDSANNSWVWVKGSSSTNQNGTYGTQGTAVPANTPGARYSAVSSIDSAGNLYVFGGVSYPSSTSPSAGISGKINDLWKFTPSTGNWTWLKGSSLTQQYAVYGSRGTGASGNTPGASQYATSWTDNSGNCWLFGGNGQTDSGSGLLNDLWKFDVSSGNWVWLTGIKNAGLHGTYGTQGTTATANTPGGRDYAASWTDSSGNLWLFGGNGYGAAGTAGRLNDLWKYNMVDGTWTWMKGSNGVDQTGTYGTQGTPHPANTPGGRWSPATWSDSHGNLWLFGGFGLAASGSVDLLNDVWRYNIATGNWTWMKGNNTVPGQAGVYGTQGVANTANIPGARTLGPVAQTAPGNKFYLFGGGGNTISSPGAYGNFNDLWSGDMNPVFATVHDWLQY